VKCTVVGCFPPGVGTIMASAQNRRRVVMYALAFVSGLLMIGLTCRRVDAASVVLVDIDSGLTSPTGDYRWLNIADQAYSTSYRDSYDYTRATAVVQFEEEAGVFRGTLTADNLKPNLAYQIKLVGTPGTPENERIGLAGRWWQEEWNGSEWANGANLNNKGDGSSPNPNDTTYFSRRDIEDASSPTGKHYRYTGYLPLDFFVTDDNGDASYAFETGSCFHVFWKTTQRTRTGNDGPVRASTFDPDPSSPAYDTDYGAATVSVFGEWERLPIGSVHLKTGQYTCSLVLTEESFHGSGGVLAGNWAAAMGAEVSFAIVPELTLLDVQIGVCHLSWLPAGSYCLERYDSTDSSTPVDTVEINEATTEYYYDVGPETPKAFFRLRKPD
jgi:hypothetical protein